MTVQAAIEAELPFLRREAEARMLDTFAIQVSLGVQYDPDLDKDVEVWETTFTTPGRVKVIGAYGIDREVGGRTTTEVIRELHIPVDSDVVPAKATALCTAIGALTDPMLLGSRLILDGPTPGSQTTARRMKVTEVLT